MPPRRKQPASSAQSQRKMKALFFSPPKHGKTHLLGTAAHDERTAPIACLDLEGGVEDVLETMPGYGTDFIRIPCRTYEEMNDAYERLLQNDEKFKSAGIDSLSETHIFMLMSLLDDKRAKREEKNQETDLIHQDDYGIALVQIRRFVRYWRDLPLHVFYTAHDKQETDVREGLVKMVNLAGKAATEIPGLMTAIGYLAVEEDETGERRVLLLKNYQKMKIGVRAPWGVQVPDEIYDPTIGKLLDAFQIK